MKKQILLSAIFSFATFSMFATDLTVTNASGDPTIEGSFPNIMASAQNDDVIKFSEQLMINKIADKSYDGYRH